MFGDGSGEPQHFDVAEFVEAVTGRLGEHPAERTVEFEPVVSAAPSPEMVAVVEDLRRRMEAAAATPSPLLSPPKPVTEEQAVELARRFEQAAKAPAPALVTFEAPQPLLPGWGWPMAESDDPTPIYDELTKTLPDPRGTEPEPATPDRPDDGNEDR